MVYCRSLGFSEIDHINLKGRLLIDENIGLGKFGAFIKILELHIKDSPQHRQYLLFGDELLALIGLHVKDKKRPHEIGED